MSLLCFVLQAGVRTDRQTERDQGASQGTQEKQGDLAHQHFSALWRRVPAQPWHKGQQTSFGNLLALEFPSVQPSAAEPGAGTAHCLLSTGHSNVRNVTHPGVRTQDPFLDTAACRGGQGMFLALTQVLPPPSAPRSRAGQ